MVRAGLIEIEEAEFEKDGEVRRYRKVRLTATGLDLRATTPVNLLISDGVVEEFGGRPAPPPRSRKAASSKSIVKNVPARADSAKPAQAAESVQLSAAGEALAARLRAWRASEARRLGVPAYLVLHDRTLNALAGARPATPRELLEIDGIGPAKVERFGEAILTVCAGN
jgi:superfamily II DNA helicase RecQ